VLVSCVIKYICFMCGIHFYIIMLYVCMWCVQCNASLQGKRTALHYAAENKASVEVIQLLLSAGAAVGAVDNVSSVRGVVHDMHIS